MSSGKSIKSVEISAFGTYPVYGGNGVRGYTEKENFSGECAIVGRQGAYCGNVRYFSGTAYMTEHAVVVQASREHNTRYLSCLLENMQLLRLSGQSAQPGLSVKVIGQQEVYLPDKVTQDKIATMIATLEDKIELNNRTNRNITDLLLVAFSSFHYRNRHCKAHKTMTIDHAVF